MRIKVAFAIVILFSVPVFAQQTRKLSADGVRAVHRHKELASKFQRETDNLRRKLQRETDEFLGLNGRLGTICGQGATLDYQNELCVVAQSPSPQSQATPPEQPEPEAKPLTPEEKEAARQKKEAEDTKKRIERENGK